jgi:hypothetical protein
LEGAKMSMMGVCGDNCKYCPRYIATQSGNIKELEKVKELWIRLGFRDPNFPVEDMACTGCKPDNTCAYEELYACVVAKGHENCGFCDEYPCKMITSVFERSDILLSKSRNVCTDEEMDILHKAFFSKKKYFDNIDKVRRRNT